MLKKRHQQYQQQTLTRAFFAGKGIFSPKTTKKY